MRPLTSNNFHPYFGARTNLSVKTRKPPTTLQFGSHSQKHEDHMHTDDCLHKPGDHHKNWLTRQRVNFFGWFSTAWDIITQDVKRVIDFFKGQPPKKEKPQAKQEKHHDHPHPH